MERPFIWQMIKEAIENLNGKATYSDIKEYIHSKYENVNDRTINAQIIVCSVNQPSRIHYPENRKPRIANSQYDFLYSVGSGKVVKYKSDEHGNWEIIKDEYDKLKINQIIDEVEIDDNYSEQIHDDYTFAYENHLRDFIEKNISNLEIISKTKLKIYQDSSGRYGIEYQTDVGIIDILAVDETNNFYVFELKVSQGSDKTIGQILRYLGWVKQILAKEKTVTGIIVANKFDDKMKYAVSMINNIVIYKYELRFDLTKVEF
jgi:RecB family endonuclease NucS